MKRLAPMAAAIFLACFVSAVLLLVAADHEPAEFATARTGVDEKYATGLDRIGKAVDSMSE